MYLYVLGFVMPLDGPLNIKEQKPNNVLPNVQQRSLQDQTSAAFIPQGFHSKTQGRTPEA